MVKIDWDRFYNPSPKDIRENEMRLVQIVIVGMALLGFVEGEIVPATCALVIAAVLEAVIRTMRVMK